MGSLVENCTKKARKKPCLPRRVEQMSKEMLQATLLKKRECNKRAQIIVERLLEECVPQDWFLSSLQYISESHFQDVVEERALTKLCGYPVCRGQLPPVPTQQFRISTRLNKVYDITDRKNFCSNWCYAAAKFLKQQLLTSPLWLRDKEDMPVFTLLPADGPSKGAGDELDFNVEKVVADRRELSQENLVTEGPAAGSCESVTHSAAEVSRDSGGSKVRTGLVTGEPVPTELESSTFELGVENCILDRSDLRKYCKANCAPLTVGNVNVASQDSKYKTVRGCIDDSIVGNDPAGTGAIRNSVETGNINSKRADESGNLSSKYLVRSCDNKCPVQLRSALESTSLDSQCTMELDRSNGKYTVVIGGLNTKCTMKSKNTDITQPSITSATFEEGKTGLEAAFDEQCEVQTKTVKKKKGKCKEDNEEPELHGVVLYVENCVKEWFTADSLRLLLGDKYQESEECQDDTGVPLVDHHAQAALRRRIVLDRLSRVVPDLLTALGVVSCDISSDVRELVATFHLSAHNITFHIPEWNLLGLVLISIVSLKNKNLQRQLRLKKVKDAQAMILLSFQQDSGYLNRLVCWLTSGP